MLKGVPDVISPELMHVLMKMGHGDSLVLADGNFPADSHAQRIVRADGLGVPALLEAILQFFPLDTFVTAPAAVMKPVDSEAAEPSIWTEYRRLLDAAAGRHVKVEQVERMAFYDRARRAYAIVATGEQIRKTGREYGTVTGRPRRCGWFDAVAAGYSARLSGIDSIAVMLLDVLSEFDELQVCVAYEINGQRTTDFPSHLEDLAAAKPVYRTVPGWRKDVSNVRRLEDFPAAARAYIDTIGSLIGSPVEIISVGPDREQTIYVK